MVIGAVLERSRVTLQQQARIEIHRPRAAQQGWFYLFGERQQPAMGGRVGTTLTP
jgi:hypothetical protein